MSENIKQRYNASTQTTTSNPFRNIDLSDGTPAIDGDVIVFGGVCDTAGAAVDFATQTTLAAIAVDAAAIEVLLGTIDTDTGAIATSVASLDTKTPALGQALAAASVPVVLTAAQISTLTPPAAITGFATESTLGTLSAKFASGTVIGDVNLGATDNAVLDAIAASVAAIDAGQLADGHNVTVSGSVTANIGTVGTLATAAKQDTGNTSLATLAGAVAGTEVQVDIVTMPNVTIAGTVTVGSHAVTNAGTFVVQVDGAALTSLQLLDDSVATTGSAITSKGMAAVGTDGTNARILKTDAAGELQIDVLTLPALAAGTNNIGDVDVLSLPALPAGSNTIGAVNFAQYTPVSGRLPVDGSGVTQPVSGTVAVTGTQTDALTDTQLRATAVPVSGTVTAELSATDNAVLDAIAASVAGTLTVGSHAVTVAAGATSFVKLEDDASANLDAGVPVMAVRKATPVNTSGTDGDYEMLQMSAGRLWVSATISSGTVTANLSTTDNDVLDVIASTVQADLISSQPTQITGGLDSGAPYAFNVSSSGIQKVSLSNSTGTAIPTSNGTHASAIRVTLANDSTGIIATVGAVTEITNALPAGTNAIGKLAANSGVTIGAVEIAAAQTLATVTTVGTLTGGGIAHDGADSGNPIKVGARAAATLSNDTMVADADRVDNVADLDGALLVRPGVPLGDLISERVTDTSGTSTAFTNFAATASTRNYITAIVVYNSSATAGTIDFRDGTAGSVLYTVPIPATGGAVISNGGSPLFRTSANTALAYDVSGALTTVTISMTGFKSKV